MEISLALSLLPSPTANYKTWQDWASALIRRLTEREPIVPVNAPSYEVALVPSIGKPGDMIWISDTEKFAYWKPATTRWRYVDESGNV